MPILAEGETMIRAKVKDETKDRLEELAGGPRKVGVYLDQVVLMLYEAQTELDTAIQEAQRGVIISAIAKGTSVMKKATKEDLEDFAKAKAIREAIERGERETVPWEEVKEDLKVKGLLSD
jgi:predicted DNA-binding protein